MTDDRRHELTGWVFVCVQVVLLAMIILLPGRGDWPVPTWLQVLGFGLVAGGLIVLAASARSLGSALTATPEPRANARLQTDGLYAHVRHPIYSGVLLVVVGLVARSGSWIVLAVGVATCGFFTVKAAWEERRLAVRYADYRDYAARTGRFVPRLRR